MSKYDIAFAKQKKKKTQKKRTHDFQTLALEIHVI